MNNTDGPTCLFGHQHENLNPFRVGDRLVDPSPKNQYRYDERLDCSVVIERSKEFQEQWVSVFHETDFPETLTVEAVGCDWVAARGGYFGTMYFMTWDYHDTQEMLVERRNSWLEKD